MKDILLKFLVLISTILLSIHPSTEQPEQSYEPVLAPYSEDNAEVEQVVEEDIKQAETVPNISRGTERKLPNVSGSFKTYMDYRTITNTDSTQWYMQQAAWTAPNGIRCYGDRYMVAMRTYYSEQCGDKFDITLSSGQVIKVITGDIKADKDTDPTNMYIEHNQNIVEFIVDVNVLNSLSQQMGDVSYSGLEGDIISIVKVEE